MSSNNGKNKYSLETIEKKSKKQIAKMMVPYSHIDYNKYIKLGTHHRAELNNMVYNSEANKIDGNKEPIPYPEAKDNLIETKTIPSKSEKHQLQTQNARDALGSYIEEIDIEESDMECESDIEESDIEVEYIQKNQYWPDRPNQHNLKNGKRFIRELQETGIIETKYIKKMNRHVKILEGQCNNDVRFRRCRCEVIDLDICNDYAQAFTVVFEICCHSSDKYGNKCGMFYGRYVMGGTTKIDGVRYYANGLRMAKQSQTKKLCRSCQMVKTTIMCRNFSTTG
eukprot:131287_1